jgi:hypothetical protein
MPVPFSIKIVLREDGPGVWKTARVDIFEGSDAAARQIGSYERNHSGWCAETFAPFMQDGRWYALYAPNYTVTKIMELPSCKDLGGEAPISHGFCPSWKIQYLDLANVSAGILVRKELFGYVAMPSNTRLKDCVSLDAYSLKYPHARLTASISHDLKKGTPVDPFE